MYLVTHCAERFGVSVPCSLFAGSPIRSAVMSLSVLSCLEDAITWVRGWDMLVYPMKACPRINFLDFALTPAHETNRDMSKGCFHSVREISLVYDKSIEICCQVQRAEAGS